MGGIRKPNDQRADVKNDNNPEFDKDKKNREKQKKEIIKKKRK